MPNYFKKANPSAVKAAATHDPVAEVTSQPLGFISNWQLTSAKKKARFDVEKRYTDAVRDEALATVELVAALHGKEHRLAEISSHAAVIGALADETLTSQQVMATTLAANRFVGSIVNIEGRQEMFNSVLQLNSEGKLSNEDVASLHATAVALHEQVEADIDETYIATKDMMNDAFRKATVNTNRKP